VIVVIREQVKFSKLGSAATYLPYTNLRLRRLYFLRRRNSKNRNNLCLTFIVTERRFHPIPMLVRGTITATGNGTDSGNGTTAPE